MVIFHDLLAETEIIFHTSVYGDGWWTVELFVCLGVVVYCAPFHLSEE